MANGGEGFRLNRRTTWAQARRSPSASVAGESTSSGLAIVRADTRSDDARHRAQRRVRRSRWGRCGGPIARPSQTMRKGGLCRLPPDLRDEDAGRRRTRGSHEQGARRRSPRTAAPARASLMRARSSCSRRVSSCRRRSFCQRACSSARLSSSSARRSSSANTAYR